MRPGAGVAPLGLPAAVRETLQIFWESPFPATLQGADFLIVDVNDAFVEFTGFERAALVGRDTIELQHEEDRAAHREKRRLHNREARHLVDQAHLMQFAKPFPDSQRANAAAYRLHIPVGAAPAAAVAL
jgi:PAS domain-containing protein